MRAGGLKGIRRLAAAAGTAAVLGTSSFMAGTAALVTPASAQVVLTCVQLSTLLDRTGINAGGGAFDTFSLTAGQTITVVWVNLSHIRLFVGIPEVLNNLAASGTFNYTVPSTGNFAVSLFFLPPGVGTGSVDITCADPVVAPPPPVVVPPAGSAESFIDGARIDRLQTNPARIDTLFGNMFDIVDGLGDFCTTLFPRPKNRAEFLKRKDWYNSEHEVYAMRPSTDEAEEFLRCEYRALTSSPYYQQGDVLSRPPGFYRQSDANPAITAGFTDGLFGGLPVGDPFLKPHLTTEFATRSAGGITRQSSFGNFGLLKVLPFGEDMAFGFGGNISLGQSTTNSPANATFNSATAGLDLLGVRRFSIEDPNLNIYLGTYLGAYAGTFQANIGGATGNGTTYGVSAGVVARTSFELFGATVEPFASGLVQSEHRNAFTDSLGAMYGASDVLTADLALGNTVSVNIYDPEHDVTISPFLSGQVILNSSNATPALGAGGLLPDQLRFKAGVGVGFDFGNGVEADIGATFTTGASTNSFGFGASMHVPIDLLFSGLRLTENDPPRPTDRIFVNTSGGEDVLVIR